jgi:hypothetical protein
LPFYLIGADDELIDMRNLCVDSIWQSFLVLTDLKKPFLFVLTENTLGLRVTFFRLIFGLDE